MLQILLGKSARPELHKSPAGCLLRGSAGLWILRLRRPRRRFFRRLRHRLADEAGWHGRRQHCASVVLLNFQAIEELFQVGVGSVTRNGAFRSVKDAEKSAELLGQTLGVVFTPGKGFRSKMDAAEITRRSTDHSWLGEQKCQAKWTRRGVVRGGIDPENRPSETGEGNVPVILPQEGRAAEGRRQLARAIDDSTEQQWIPVIGRGHGVHPENGDAQRASFQRDAVDVHGTVVLDRAGNLAQVGPETSPLDPSDEDFGKVWRLGGARG